MKKRTIAERRLYGPSYQRIAELRRTVLERIGNDGRAFVYRAGETATSIVISGEEVVGYGELVACYDANVTAPMLREDLYGVEPDDVSYEELRRMAR